MYMCTRKVVFLLGTPSLPARSEQPYSRRYPPGQSVHASAITCQVRADMHPPCVYPPGQISHAPAITHLVRADMHPPLPAKSEETYTHRAVIRQVRAAMLPPLPNRSEQTYNRHYLLGQSRHASAVTNQVRACNFYLRMSPKVNQRCKKE